MSSVQTVHEFADPRDVWTAAQLNPAASDDGSARSRADEVGELRAEVGRLRTLLVTENVGLAVGILMVHRRCGAREALAGLVGLSLATGRTMIQESDRLVARYDRHVTPEESVDR